MTQSTAWQEERQSEALDRYRQELWWALRTRRLSEREMEAVRHWGDHLNIEPCVPFDRAQKAKELNDALLAQYRLREFAPAPGVLRFVSGTVTVTNCQIIRNRSACPMIAVLDAWQRLKAADNRWRQLRAAI